MIWKRLHELSMPFESVHMLIKIFVNSTVAGLILCLISITIHATMLRSSEGQFKAACATKVLHETLGVSCDDSNKLEGFRKLRKNVVTSLCQDANLILPPSKLAKAKFCRGCINAAYELNPSLMEENVGQDHDAYTKRTKFDMNSHCIGTTNIHTQTDPMCVDSILSAMSTKEHEVLTYKLGLMQYENVKFSSHEATKLYRNVSEFQKFRVKHLQLNQNKVIVKFIKGVTGIPKDEILTSSKEYMLTKTVESILHLGTAAVLPLHFRESLVLYSVTKSKLALQILTYSGAHASYATIKLWLETLASQKCVESRELRPVGDIVIAFDNNQMLQKTWAVRVGNKFKCSAITMNVAFEMNSHGTLQLNGLLKPSLWCNTNLTSVQIQKLKYVDQNDEVKKIHYDEHLYPFISGRIQKVLKEQQMIRDGDCITWHDAIDKQASVVIRYENYNVCQNCDKDNPKNKRKCLNCNGKISSQLPPKAEVCVHIENDDLVEKEFRMHVDEKGSSLSFEILDVYLKSPYSMYHCPNKDKVPKVRVLQPTSVNPNSYQSVHAVLVDIGKKVGIYKYGTGDKQHVLIYCDGVPYNLAYRLIQCTFRCSTCNETFAGKTKCKKHLDDHPNATFDLEFDWCLMQPGGGHIEMNMVKAFVDLTWEIFWKDMVGIFNFKSDNALRCAKKVTDHHKGWALCCIARNALTDELLVPYIRHCLKQNPPNQPSVDGFFKYVMLSMDPNYSFMADIVFELLDAVFMYRTGLRTGIIKLAMAGRAKFSKVWCARAHSLYRELDAHDMILRERMPPCVQTLVDESMSLNLSGKPYTGEGPDFRLEEINKRVQQFMPLIPTDDAWKRVCANYDSLLEIRENMFSDKGRPGSEDTSFKAHYNPTGEFALRTEFRKKEYLSNPCNQKMHVSLSGEELNPDLVSLLQQARTNRAIYIDEVLQHETKKDLEPGAVSSQIKPIYITLKEKETWDSVQTKKETAKLVEQHICKIVNPQQKDAWLETWISSFKNKNGILRHDYVAFYNELQEFLESDVPDFVVNDNIVENT